MKYISLALAALVSVAAVPSFAGNFSVDVGIGIPAPVAPPAYYVPAPVYGAPPPVYVPRPVYTPRPVVVAPAPQYVPDWRWREDEWRRREWWRHHHHERWHREDDDD